MFESMAKITLKNHLEHSEYYWGDNSEVAGNTYRVIEFALDNSGDALCLIKQNGKEGLMMIDHRDIAKVEHITPNIDESDMMAAAMMVMTMFKSRKKKDSNEK